MPSHRQWQLLSVAAALLGSAACGETDYSHYAIQTVFDPCSALVIVPAADTDEPERAGVVEALEYWNRTAATRLTVEDVEGAPRIPLVFEKAARAFYGFYDDRNGIVFINRNLEDGRSRAVTVAHELGHAFGLLHVSRDTRLSLMNPSNLELPPTDEDAGALAALWGRCDMPAAAPR